MQSRIRYLDNEDAKMQKKVGQTRRLAEKIAVARDLAEEKLGRMVRLDEVREAQQRELAFRAEEERIRRKLAAEKARKDIETAKLEESLAARREKLYSLSLAEQ